MDGVDDDGFGGGARIDAVDGDARRRRETASPPMSAGEQLRAQGRREAVAEQTFIWGTQVNVRETQNRFRRFIENFELRTPRCRAGPRRLRAMQEKEETHLDIDCQHVHEYDEYLYKLLVMYPQEIIPLFDVKKRTSTLRRIFNRRTSAKRRRSRCESSFDRTT